MRNRRPRSDFDELELAVTDMRARFLSIGENIASLLGTLARHIDSAPAHARASIHQAADQIARTQQRLKAQVAHLPARPQERYQIMRSLLQAQQGALQQLRIIVDQHAPRGAAAAQWTSSAETQRETAAPARGRAARRAGTRRSGTTLMQAIGSGALAVIGLLVAASVAAYLYFPADDSAQQRDRTRTTTTTAGEREDLVTGSTDKADTSTAIEERRVTLPGIVVTRPLEGRDRSSDGAARTSTRGQLPLATGNDSSAETAETGTNLSIGLRNAARQTRDLALGEERGTTTSSTSTKPAIAASESESVTAEPEPARFVAVVFTHKDRTAALDAFSDLQHRYPGVLAQRKAEAQAIELAEKGTWHRLVVLPAGTRSGAWGLCERLRGAGYERCWVKAY